MNAPMPQTPDEHELETGIKSKEARKYIFNCLDDMSQINVPNNIAASELLAEKADRFELVNLLKSMLALDQERRITPSEALDHSFLTMSHLVDYAHCHVYVARLFCLYFCILLRCLEYCCVLSFFSFNVVFVAKLLLFVFFVYTTQCLVVLYNL